MSKKLDLIEWIRTGRMMDVTLGASKVEVEAGLGAPVGWALDSTERASNYLDVDIWGYGVWTLYFESGLLDAVTCAVESLAPHGWHFDINNFDNRLLGGVIDVQHALNLHGIQSRTIERRYHLQDTIEGKTIEIARRLTFPTLLAGEDFRTRILFDEDATHVRVLGNPFSLKHQVLSSARIRDSNQFQLI